MSELYILKKIVENYFKIADISVRCRRQNYVKARVIYSIVARQTTVHTMSEIGEIIKRDHSSINYFINQTYQSWLLFFKHNNQNLNIVKIIYDNFIEIISPKNDKMKKNPYRKYLGKEDVLQNSVINYIKLQYPKALVIHVPNEGKRTPFERYKFKFLGGVSGVPDILIFNKNLKYCGLAIELKVGYNKPTENQEMFLNRLKNANWDACWSNNFDSTKKIIDNYFTNIDNV